MYRECLSRYYASHAYKDYLRKLDYWRNVEIPAWKRKMDHYWQVYLPNYLASVRPRGAMPFSRNKLPPNQTPLRMSKDSDSGTFQYNNPNRDLRNSASDATAQAQRNKFGLNTYLQFVLDQGRNLQPDDKTYAPIAKVSSHHVGFRDTVSDPEAGSISLNFAPPTQPMHAARRSMIRALKIIAHRNRALGADYRDRIAVIGFDGDGTVFQGLSPHYSSVMQQVASLQAVGDMYATTNMESGMLLAFQELKNNGRDYAKKTVIVLSDGSPNKMNSNSATVNGYISGVDSDAQAMFYNSDPLRWTGSKDWFNAPIRMSHKMYNDEEWEVFAAGVGFGANTTFLQRLTTAGGTQKYGLDINAGGDPDTYEQELTRIFKEIISIPHIELVD